MNLEHYDVYQDMNGTYYLYSEGKGFLAWESDEEDYIVFDDDYVENHMEFVGNITKLWKDLKGFQVRVI